MGVDINIWKKINIWILSYHKFIIRLANAHIGWIIVLPIIAITIISSSSWNMPLTNSAI